MLHVTTHGDDTAAVQDPGTHEPLVIPEVFRRVQELLAARAARGTRERKHPHYLKGLLHCGVCGRRLSIQHSKGRYVYFFGLGQKNDPLGTCREPYIAADDLETEVEDLYQRIQLPESWAERLREKMAAEITERHAADAAQRVLLTGQLAKAEGERRKLLDAYYGGAIDVPMLKTEQTRIGSAIDTARDRLVDLDANVGEQQEILELAASLATRWGDAYRKPNNRTRELFNAAVFERLDVKGGQLCHEQYRPPFDGVFTVSEFEYGTRVVVVPPRANRERRSPVGPSTWASASRLFPPAGTRWSQPSRRSSLVGERRPSPWRTCMPRWSPADPPGAGRRWPRPCCG